MTITRACWATGTLTVADLVDVHSPAQWPGRMGERWLGQAGLMSHRLAAVPAPRSGFAGFRFPPEVIGE
jgi:hypothetical protein